MPLQAFAALTATAYLLSATSALPQPAPSRPSLRKPALLQYARPPTTTTPAPRHAPLLLSAAAQPGGSAFGAMSRVEKLSVFAVLSAALLNLLGFTMLLGFTPALGEHFGIPVGAKFGMLTSAYPLGMLAGVFIWPQLSDRVGRKPVLALSLAGSGLGLLLQGLAVALGWPLRAFLWLRVLTGSCAGASPVAKAYLADIGQATGRLPSYMAWRDAASTGAFIVGPALSGQLYAMIKEAASQQTSLATPPP